MSDDTRLLAHALGLLPAGARDELDEDLRAQPALAARARRIRADLASVDAQPPAWLLPLPGRCRGPVQVRATASVDAWLDLGAAPLRPASVLLHLPPALLDHRMLLLFEQDGGWRLHEPAPGAPPRRVRELSPDGGGWRLDLLLTGEGPRECAIVLVPDDVAPGLVGGDEAALAQAREAVADLRCVSVVVLLD